MESGERREAAGEGRFCLEELDRGKGVSERKRKIKNPHPFWLNN